MSTMRFPPMVKSLLDTDLYKFTMNQCIFHQHTDLTGIYTFKCRNEDVRFTPEMVEEIDAQIDHLCTRRFRQNELDYLRSIRFLKSDYIEFLRLWRPIRDYVSVSLNKNGTLEICVAGPIFSCMLFEIYILEIVNETYFRMKYDYDNKLLPNARSILNAKIESFNLENGGYNFKFAEFGCRRRLSGDWQDELLGKLSSKLENKNMVGTSNVYFAKKYNLKPIGTYAHEFVQMFQGIESIPLAYTNHYALESWYKEYKGDLGTALTDTLGTDLFLLDFDRSNANNYTGVRHDSGNPFTWGEKIIDHYESLGIDPKTKTLLFSDSLNFYKAQQLYDYFKNRINVSFGIGTFITNDTGYEPLNIVLKLQYVNGRPVAKLSDSDGKEMCSDEKYLKYLKNSVAYRLGMHLDKYFVLTY